MTARRRLLAAASAAVAVAALAGCERPAPIVTVVSGASSQWKEADRWCFEGTGDCVERGSGPTRIEVAPGQRVGVDVDKDVVERGWYIELSSPGQDGQPQTSDLQVDRHYFSFTAPNAGPQGLRLTVRAVDRQDPSGEPTGEWTFDLVPR